MEKLSDEAIEDTLDKVASLNLFYHAIFHFVESIHLTWYSLT